MNMGCSSCETCLHWHEQKDLTNLAATAAGQCRAMPPQLVLIPQPDGSLMLSPYYPTLGPSFPSCGLHKVVALELPASNGQQMEAAAR